MAIISSRPSVALVKPRWRKKGAPRSLADCAGVIGANIWKISLEIFRHMEKEEFRFGSDRLVTEVMTEFIAFLVQLVDRGIRYEDDLVRAGPRVGISKAVELPWRFWVDAASG